MKVELALRSSNRQMIANVLMSLKIQDGIQSSVCVWLHKYSVMLL